jgi:hypothetical protein
VAGVFFFLIWAPWRMDDEISACAIFIFFFFFSLALLTDSLLHFLRLPLCCVLCCLRVSIYTFELGTLQLSGLEQMFFNRHISMAIKRGSKGIHLIKTVYGQGGLKRGERGSGGSSTKEKEENKNMRKKNYKNTHKTLRQSERWVIERSICAVLCWASGNERRHVGSSAPGKRATRAQSGTLAHTDIQAADAESIRLAFSRPCFHVRLRSRKLKKKII